MVVVTSRSRVRMWFSCQIWGQLWKLEMLQSSRQHTARQRCRQAGLSLAALCVSQLLLPSTAFLPTPARPSSLTVQPLHIIPKAVKLNYQSAASPGRPLLKMASAYADTRAAATPPSSLAELSATRGTSKQRFVFFGGKGGVGKTSTSAAMAVYLADEGLRTLVISTDPAHSLGDVLDQKVSGGEPTPVLGMDNLWAMEVDASKALDKFKELFKDLDLNALTEQFGANLDLGLDEITGLLENPPPGIDELIALADVVQLTTAADGRKFDRIVIDTAPTGHTLRLLSFPDFLDSFLGKIIKFQVRLSGLLNTLSGMFGGAAKEGQQTMSVEEAFKKIEAAKERMVQLRELFRNSDATEFCIVTIPTQLAVAETRRLLSSLKKEGIAVRHMVVNKLVEQGEQAKHMERIIKGQSGCIKRLSQGTVARNGLSLLTVPYFDVEVRGVYGLKFMADSAFGADASTGPFPDLFVKKPGLSGPKFVVLGGKGGVGKTSSSGALAVKSAEEGLTTIVVSTDPAHSLGDALDIDLSTGKVTEVQGLYNAAPLYALEVDTEEALVEFKEILRDLSDNAAGKGGGEGGMAAGLMKELGEFAEVLDQVPPGSDELVALATVVKLIKEGSPCGKPYDCVVIDTAPTGHTLRLLSFPEFLEQFFERLMTIRDRLGKATSFLNMFSGGGGGDEGVVNEVKRDRLKEFQFKMIELDGILHDSEQTEFVVVTIPTEMAVAETERLVESLKEQDVAVRRVIVNQVLRSDVQEAYWDRLRAGQHVSLKEAGQLAKAGGVRVTKVPFFDTEMRSVYALRVLAKALVDGADVDAAS